MAVQMGDHNKIRYINLIMEEIHVEADSIYESLMDEDDERLHRSLQQLSSILTQIKANHVTDQKAT
jgi:PHD/YefM family antitoxin component YafN of YafNO toxin-antitoxin module